MTIVLVAVCTVLTILCISLYFKVNGLKKDLDDCKNLIDLTNKIQDKSNLDISNLSRILDDVVKKVGNARLQEYANTAVSEALDGVDFDLERYDNAIKAMWQAIGTQKKRLDKIDPIKREPIDPAENLKHQSELMDKMLKQSTDIYAEKLSKNKATGMSQTGPVIEEKGKLYSKYMEKLNDVKDNFPATKEPDTAAFPSDPEIEQYATTQIPTFANNSVEDLDETMDISEFFTRVKNN